jgi:hypothetical protein
LADEKKKKKKKYQNTEATVVTGKAVGLNMTAEENRHMVMTREGNAGRNQSFKRKLINSVRTWQSLCFGTGLIQTNQNSRSKQHPNFRSVLILSSLPYRVSHPRQMFPLFITEIRNTNTNTEYVLQS